MLIVYWSYQPNKTDQIKVNEKSINLLYITGTTEYFDKIQYNGNSENWQHDIFYFYASTIL